MTNKDDPHENNTGDAESSLHHETKLFRFYRVHWHYELIKVSSKGQYSWNKAYKIKSNNGVQ